MRRIVILFVAFQLFSWAQSQPTASVLIAASSMSSTSRINATNGILTNSVAYLSGSSAFSVAFWAKATSASTTNSYILQMGNASTNASVIYGFVSTCGTSMVEFFVAGATGTSPRTGSQICPADTNWHHIAYTYNGTSWDYYLDGVQHVINASITFALGTMPSLFRVFNSNSGAGAYPGSVARLLITTSALTSGQVTQLYTTCSSSGITNVAGYWLIGTASPDPESPPSPNTNSLTITNTLAVSSGPPCVAI